MRPSRARTTARLASVAGLVFFVAVVAEWVNRMRVRLATEAPRATWVTTERRREVFASIARNEDQRWSLARQAFPDDEWSRHDHYAAYMRDDIAMAASIHRLSYEDVLAIYDQGVHERWAGPSGRPLQATWVKLQPRIR